MISVALCCAASCNVTKRSRMMVLRLMGWPNRPIVTFRLSALTGLGVVALRTVGEGLTV